MTVFSNCTSRIIKRLCHHSVKPRFANVQVAERTITSDLEGLIKAAVDTQKADYAVVTGVQIHNW